MRNLLAIRVESWLGSVFIFALAAFFIGLLFIAIKNFDFENEVLDATSAKIRHARIRERAILND